MSYSKICICKHVEGSHLRTSGKCRSKKCDCRRFLNDSYIRWMVEAANDMLREVKKLRRELINRLSDLSYP